MNKSFLLLLLLFAGIETMRVEAQHLTGQLSKDASVSILTVGPADPASTMFGHTAIRLQDSTHKIDRVYNYGTFDFDSPNFYLKFLYGDLQYYLSVSSFKAFKQENVALGRSVVSQTLNLSLPEVKKLVKRLEQNHLPENRSYQYRFFRQNCVTQVRNLLEDQNLWSSPKLATTPVLSENTYRQQLSAYLTQRPWTKLGINLMLGSQADRSITDSEKNFLPNTFHLTLANSLSASGQPLVASSEILVKPATKEHRAVVPPIFVLWVVFLALTVFTSTSLVMEWQGRWVDQLIFGIIGAVGLIIAFGSLVSLHQPLHFNWNLLWALPTHLLVAVAMPWLKPKWLKAYFSVTLLLGISVIIGWNFIPQQIPVAVIPVISVLLIRSMYRFYVANRSEWLKRNHVINHRKPLNKQYEQR